MKSKAIFGYGGFASEVCAYLKPKYPDIIHFVDSKYYVSGNPKLFSIDEFSPEEFEIVIAVANPSFRKSIAESLPDNTQYFSFVHDSCILSDENIKIGEGSIICPNCIITTDVILGKHTHLNLGTTIGHNTRIGNYFTTAPSVNISGDCVIKDLVYFGTNSCVKEKINICEDVTIGMCTGVVKNIEEKGTYIGVPAKKIK